MILKFNLNITCLCNVIAFINYIHDNTKPETVITANMIICLSLAADNLIVWPTMVD